MKNEENFVQKLRQKLENSEKFIYWNKAIGLTFDDFDIVEIDNYTTIKKGKKDIGVYAIFIKNGVVDCIAYDTNNEYTRRYNLEEA